MGRQTWRWVRAAGWFCGGAYAIGLGGCDRFIQQNIEVLFAPAVLQNGFLLPFTWIFRMLGGLV